MFFRRTAVVGLLLSFCGFASAEQGPPKGCETNTELGVPGGSDITLCHDGYATGYSYQFKIPVWCSYWIERRTVDINVERSDDFRAHPGIPEPYRSGREDYRGSGFDRGHCAPSASIDYSEISNSETFFYSNMFPQKPGFNRDMMGYKGVWGYLENEVRKWARERESVFVISGAHVDEGAIFIGNGVAVPTHFFKIVISPKGPEAIAFWMPHQENTKHDVLDYLVSVDFIERETGLDFSPLLQDEQEEMLESAIPSKLW